MSDQQEQRQNSKGEAPCAGDKVGYKSPPKQHRFAKGKSGNPGGRRRGARGRKAIVERVLLEMRRVEIDGRLRELTMIELVVLALRQEALSGKARAFKVYERLDGFCGPQRQSAHRAGCLVAPYVKSLEQWTALWGPDGEAWKLQARGASLKDG